MLTYRPGTLVDARTAFDIFEPTIDPDRPEPGRFDRSVVCGPPFFA